MAKVTEVEAIVAIDKALSSLDDEDARSRVLQWACQKYAPGESRTLTPSDSRGTTNPQVTPGGTGPAASAATSGMTAKQFVARKNPTTDVERVAVLGYFLTHENETPKFKTRDITSLNTEAAQHKFANPSMSVANATRQNGFLADAGKGAKQMTAYGDAFVDALPDRDRVAEVGR